MTEHVASYYRDSQQVRLAPTTALAGAHRTQVAVIGGGITGCSAALHLAEAGFDVRLLEARRIGWGASGRSGGQILTGFGAEMGTIAGALGADAAREAWAMSREAVRLTETLIARHHIPCDYRHGAIYAALKPRHLRAYRAFQQEMREVYGYDGFEWLDRDALRDRVVSDAYIGGLREAESGHLHPLNYTLGLARAAQAAGVRIHEQSPALSITHGRPVRLTTAAGSIDADAVVLAGNAYLDAGLAPGLRGKLMPVGNYLIATEPLTAEQVARTLPGDDAVSDANFVLDYFRLSADRRMLYGGQVSYGRREPRRLRQRMQAKLVQLFPALAGIAIDYHWGGRVGVTFDRTPHFGRLAHNVYFAQGFSGHGMALAGLSGQLMADAVVGRPARFDLYARLRHRRFPGGDRLRTPLLVLATNFYRMRDRF